MTNGTAVLGLGNIGPYAAKPVMEGKAVLFKRFADIDVFDIEMTPSTQSGSWRLSPRWNRLLEASTEDVRAPDCFLIERMLRERMRIPVFHDDQHGTAIIAGAALKNAAVLQDKDLSKTQVVCIGAGAAAVACIELWIQTGLRRENVVMIDSKGVIREDREGGVDEAKAAFALRRSDSRRTVQQAFEKADEMLGVATAGLVTPEMIKAMAPRPIIFALANPDPEIPNEVAVATRPDAIVATGRSDSQIKSTTSLVSRTSFGVPSTSAQSKSMIN